MHIYVDDKLLIRNDVEVVISLLPPNCHIFVANACIELKKYLVTASYVDQSLSMLDEEAKNASITVLGEMGLDPGIDHMMAMKMINEARARKGIIRSFNSYCGGLPSPAAANNPLAYKFSWNPAGAIRAGRNPAIYRSRGETVHVDGELPKPRKNPMLEGLYDHKKDLVRLWGRFRRSLMQRPTFGALMQGLLKVEGGDLEGPLKGEEDIAERIVRLGYCKDQATALKAAKTIIFLGLNEQTEIPESCEESAFDVTCLRMVERLAYSAEEQDMVLLHHEVEVDFAEDRHKERHTGTLLEFGRTKNGKTTTAMALTVGIPAAIGALLILENKIKTRGVLRPIEPEVYLPALDILQAYGFKLMERMK